MGIPFLFADYYKKYGKQNELMINIEKLKRDSYVHFGYAVGFFFFLAAYVCMDKKERHNMKRNRFLKLKVTILIL